MSETEIWYLAYPDRIEEIGWEDWFENLEQYLDAKGPFPNRELAVEFQFTDHVAGYWLRGIPVIAHHCPGCGKFAKVLAFNDEAGWSWHVTECKKCGVIDDRNA